MKTLNAKQLNMMIDGDTDVIVFDVLPEESFEKQHVPGAKNAPANDPNFVKLVEDEVSDKNQPVAVYCADTECDLSPKAAEKLEEAGFTNVYDFEGGIDEWKREGFELAGHAPST